MSSRAEQKQQTRRALMDAALRLSADRGFGSLSLRAVAQEAGIAPASFYRHFDDMDDLGLALVDEVGVSLRRLIRQARSRVTAGGTRHVIVNSISTFMEFAAENPQLFRLLLGEGAWSTQAFRHALSREISLFAKELAEDLEREAAVTGRPIAHVQAASEAMCTIAFNLGAAAIDLSPAERRATADRIVLEVRMILRGAQAMAAEPVIGRSAAVRG